MNAALRWIAARPRVDSDRVAVVGASYSGEAIGEALRGGGDAAAAYVMLSPGSFSDASIALIDPSEASWLFVRTTEESEVSVRFVDAVFDAIEAESQSAELRVVSGAGHATHILDEHPSIVEDIADWLARQLRAAQGR